MMLFCLNYELWQMLLPICLVIAHILCQMLIQYKMADVEPILWQMLLPMFNNVVGVITTCLLKLSQV